MVRDESILDALADPVKEVEIGRLLVELSAFPELAMIVRRMAFQRSVVSEKARPEGAVGEQAKRRLDGSEGVDLQASPGSTPSVTHGTTDPARPLAIAIYRAWADDLKHDYVPFEELADCTKDAFMRAADAARDVLLPRPPVSMPHPCVCAHDVTRHVRGSLDCRDCACLGFVSDGVR